MSNASIPCLQGWISTHISGRYSYSLSEYYQTVYGTYLSLEDLLCTLIVQTSGSIPVAKFSDYNYLDIDDL